MRSLLTGGSIGLRVNSLGPGGWFGCWRGRSWGAGYGLGLEERECDAKGGPGAV